MEVSKNFILQEFIDPDTWDKFGEQSIWFLDFRIIRIAQKLRDRLDKPITINNWWSSGDFKLSGFRPPDSEVGAHYSQHRFGRAIDPKILGQKNRGADLIADEIQTNYSIYGELGLTTIENPEATPLWCHLDCRQTNSDELLIVNP